MNENKTAAAMITTAFVFHPSSTPPVADLAGIFFRSPPLSPTD